MMRLGAIFVAVCMVIIAGSAGATLYLYLGVSASEAATFGVATLTALALYNIVTTRIGASNGGRPAARRPVARRGRARPPGRPSMGGVSPPWKARSKTRLDRTRAVTDPLAAEIGELGTLVKQLAETVAAHQTAIDALARAPAASPAAPAGVLAAEALAQFLAAAQAAPIEAAPPQASDAEPDARHPAPAAQTVDAQTQELEATLATIRAAIDANRVDLYLQPIVTLPQRKVRYYEAMSRLRTERGDVAARGRLHSRRRKAAA